MNKRKKSARFCIGRTKNGKQVNLPIRIEEIDIFIQDLPKNFSCIDIFEIYAMSEYLCIHENRKSIKQDDFLEIFTIVSAKTRHFLESKGKFNKVRINANVKDSLETLKLGKSLVLPEFR